MHGGVPHAALVHEVGANVSLPGESVLQFVEEYTISTVLIYECGTVVDVPIVLVRTSCSVEECAIGAALVVESGAVGLLVRTSCSVWRSEL